MFVWVVECLSHITFSAIAVVVVNCDDAINGGVQLSVVLK